MLVSSNRAEKSAISAVCSVKGRGGWIKVNAKDANVDFEGGLNSRFFLSNPVADERGTLERRRVVRDVRVLVI